MTIHYVTLLLSKAKLARGRLISSVLTVDTVSDSCDGTTDQ